MLKKLLSLTLLGLFISTAQAGMVTFTDTFDTQNEIQMFTFDVVGGTGAVDIWMDTLSDGADLEMTFWKQSGSQWLADPTGAGLWYTPGADRDPNSVNNGLNVFGVQLRNGWVAGDVTQQGTSDPGTTVTLDPGTYLITVHDNPNLNINTFTPSGPMGTNWLSNGQFDTFAFNNDGTQDYEVYVSGQFVQGTAPVPVPAAVWLFGTALMGLTGMKRKKA